MQGAQPTTTIATATTTTENKRTFTPQKISDRLSVEVKGEAIQARVLPRQRGFGGGGRSGKTRPITDPDLRKLPSPSTLHHRHPRLPTAQAKAFLGLLGDTHNRARVVSGAIGESALRERRLKVASFTRTVTNQRSPAFDWRYTTPHHFIIATV